MSAALLNISVMVAGYFRLIRYRRQLFAAVEVVTALFGAIVHSNVIPSGVRWPGQVRVRGHIRQVGHL